MTRDRILTFLALACVVLTVAYSFLHFFETGEGDVALASGLVALGAFVLRQSWWSAAATFSGFWATLNAVKLLIRGAQIDGWVIGVAYLVVGVLLTISGALLARRLRRPADPPLT